MSAAPKIVIVGASGAVGKATIAHLVKHTDPATVHVVTRNPGSATAEEFKRLGVHVEAGDLASPDSLAGPFSGATTVLIILPAVENRTELGLNGVEAAKAARVGHITLQSVANANIVTTVFGSQFNPVEKATKASGLPWTIIRLPLFLENLWGQAGSIKSVGKFFGGFSPDAKHSEVTTDNLGEATAVVLTTPTAHAGQTYLISGPPLTNREVAAALSAATGKTVEYVQLPHDTLKASFLESGRAPWQVAGMFDSIRAIDAGAYGYDHSDFKTLTGKEPKTLVEWADSVKAGFQ